MQVIEVRTASVRSDEATLKKKLEEFQHSRAVMRLLDSYGKLRTKRGYASCLSLYLAWLREKGVTMSPDELVTDNLVCVFKSDPTDVTTKRRHTDWLADFVNLHLVEKGLTDKRREVYAASVIQFYKRNDSPLWGSFSISRHEVEESAPALEVEDIRKVLKAAALGVRGSLPLRLEGGNRDRPRLSLKWKDVEGIERGESPLALRFLGRKRHRRPYSTFIETDGIENLKIWRGRWTEQFGREPSPQRPNPKIAYDDHFDSPWKEPIWRPSRYVSGRSACAEPN